MQDFNSKQTSESQATSSKGKNFNPYSGGRHLNAIRYSDLTPTQKHILLELTCRMDFRSNFQDDPIIVSKGSMAKFTGYSRDTIGRNLIKLEKQKYVIQNNEPGSNSSIRLTSKLFDEYAVKMSKDSESRQAKMSQDLGSIPQDDLRSKVEGGTTQSRRGYDLESIQYSPFTPLINPLYIKAGQRLHFGHSAIAQIRRYDNINYKLYKEKSMSLSEHPFMTTLKKGKAEREAKKPQIVEAPKARSSLGETSNDLFNRYKNYFSGGFGKFCYKAQRAMWDQSTINDCVEELKNTVEFHHGPDKHAACQIAAHRRMTDAEYAQHLLDEALGEKRRIAKDKADRQAQIDSARERARLEADPEWQAEQERQRKIRVEKLLAAREKLKRAIR